MAKQQTINLANRLTLSQFGFDRFSATPPAKSHQFKIGESNSCDFEFSLSNGTQGIRFNPNISTGYIKFTDQDFIKKFPNGVTIENVLTPSPAP